MSLSPENADRLFATARNTPLELSREQVELLFLNPVPSLPAKPWYANYLKFFKMLSILLAAVISFTVVLSTEDAATADSPVAAAIPRPEIPPSSPAFLAPTPVPTPTAAVEKQNTSVEHPTTRSAPTTAPAPAAAPNLQLPATEPATNSPKLTPIPSIIPERSPEPLLYPGIEEAMKMRAPSPDTLHLNLPVNMPPTATSEVTKVKWGLEQAGYIADTLKTCCSNNRISTMELKMKGKFRLMLNPNLDRKHMIVYGKPAAIAALKKKVSFRKLALRNYSKELVIDLEVNPSALEGFRIKNNKTELVDYRE